MVVFFSPFAEGKPLPVRKVARRKVRVKAKVRAPLDERSRRVVKVRETTANEPLGVRGVRVSFRA